MRVTPPMIVTALVKTGTGFQPSYGANGVSYKVVPTP